MDILIAQETELHQYETRQNIVDIERLIHPSFVEVGKSGTCYDFDLIIKTMQAEVPSNVRIHSQHYECTQLEPSVQLLRYESALVNESGEASDFAKRCSIWAFNGSCWQIKYHQGTPCEPFELITNLMDQLGYEATSHLIDQKLTQLAITKPLYSWPQ